MAFYLLDKPQGITSNKALSFIKKEYNISKAGFSGVLDPFATGLLIVATKGDTKFLDLFLHSPKTYSGTILFGKRTDTFDIDGEVEEEIDGVKIDFEEIKNLIGQKFTGVISQVPPKHSNIKVNGKRAHELTRKGNFDFELKPVQREIYSFDIKQISDNEIEFLVKVSSGTYIRSLARDIGDELKLPSMLTSLRREAIGDIKPVEKETILIERKEIVPFTFKEISNDLMTIILQGKDVEIDSVEDDLIVVDQTRTVWLKKKSPNKYKIHKNIE